MNTTRWLAGCIVLLLVDGSAFAAETAAVTRVALTLTDGSRVMGVCRADTVKVTWQGQEIALRVATLRRIQLGGETNAAQVLLANGDAMKAALRLKAFPLETLFGVYDIKTDVVRTAEFFAQAAGGAMAEEGLLLYYSFDNVAGDRVPDLSGNGNDGKINGAKVVEGKFGFAMSFANKADNVEVKDLPGLKFGVDDDATLALWWKGTGNLHHAPLLTKTLAPGRPEGRGFCLFTLLPEGYYIPAYAACFAMFPVAFPSGEWHHVTVVKKGRVWRVYHDGNELQMGRTMAWPCEDITVDAPLLIGGGDAPGWRAFNGCIDEVRIYKRALSADEVRGLAEKK